MRVSSSPILDMVGLLNFSHFGRREWYHIVVLIICYQVINYFEHFSCAYLPPYVSLGEVSVQIFCPFFWLGCLLSYYF